MKALAIQSDTIRRWTVDREDLKPHWKSENIFQSDQPAYCPKVFQSIIHKALLIIERRLNRAVVLCHTSFPTFVITRASMRPFNSLENKIPLHTYWRVQLLYMKIKFLTVLRTTTGIESGPYAFGKSRLVMTLLTNLGVTEILYSFILALKCKTGKGILESSRLEFLEMFSASSNTLPDAEYNTSRLLNRGSITYLPLLRTPFIISPESQVSGKW